MVKNCATRSLLLQVEFEISLIDPLRWKTITHSDDTSVFGYCSIYTPSPFHYLPSILSVCRNSAGDTPLPLEIVHYPHPTLRHKSRPLKKVDAELKKLVAEMFDLMYEHEGIGLAANQVDLPYRLFVVNATGDSQQPDAELAYINPVLSGGKGQAEDREGCLSVPGVYSPVVRNETINIEAYDLAGNEIKQELSGLDARVVMHETDHLDGTMFFDRISPTNLAAIRDSIAEFEIEFESKQSSGEAPGNEAIAARLAELESLRT